MFAIRRPSLGFAGVAVAAVLTAAIALSPGHTKASGISPAEPQPAEDQLKPGLSVLYAYQNIKWLRDVEPWIEAKGEPGTPLPDLAFYSDENEPALTTKRSELVLAEIRGFLRFPESGSYELEFASNDGLRVYLGAEETEVYKHDGRHVCDTLGPVTVEIPTAGWYPIHIEYFQRYKSSCLWLSWRKPGDAEVGDEPVPEEHFAHVPQ